MATIRIEGVAVRYESVAALEDVTLEVASGEWLSLVGPNGAGKTTLLRAMATALPVSSGAILLNGDSITRMRARDRARNIAVMPQDQSMPAGWTVGEVVAQGRSPHLGAWSRERPEDREAVSSALLATFTVELADRQVETLSGGERQRVLLARALAQAPRVLLLDEPTAFLDLQYQWEMLELVERARLERGITAVSVLHDLNLASAFSDRIALLKAGRILALGAPEDVFTEGIIEEGYGRRVTVGRHPASGRPTVTSWPTERRPALPSRVHVICGGGTGAALMRRLVSDGHQVTAGVLNVGDTDWETARALGLEVAAEAPFSAISAGAFEAAEVLVRAARHVLVAPMPVGPGNLDNLRLAVEAATLGHRVVLIGRMDANRDYADGQAAALWNEALARGAEQVADSSAAIATLAGSE